MNQEPNRNASRRRPPRRRGRLGRLLGLGLAVALAVAVAVALLPEPIAVETARVERAPLTISVTDEGRTRIRNRYEIYPPFSGFLDRVELRAGAPIQAGRTVLAVIQPEATGFLPPRVRAEAEARVRAAEAAVELRQAELDRVRTEQELAERELERAESLRQAEIISERELDEARTRARAGERQVRAAEFALNVARFEAEQARAALVQAQSPERNDYEPTRILAPVDGYVLRVMEESARVISPGEPIMEVGDPRDLEAEIELLSIDAVQVEPGADAWIEHWGGEQLRGRVALVEPGGFTKVSALGVEEQRVIARIDFIDQPPPERRMGDRFRVEASIVVWHGEDVLQAPTGALFRREGQWMAFVVEEGRAHLRQVRIGRAGDVAAEIIEGLAAGDRVILHPPEAVSDGAAVREN